MMCCYRLAAQIKRREAGIWEHREENKRKDRMMAVMGLHNKESEGQHILKGNVKRIVSGMLSAATVLSAFLQPLGAYAAGPESAAYEAEYPALEKVKERLAADEIVVAEDYTVEIDSGFDVEHDLSGMEFLPDKVKITFYEAKDKAGKKFDIGKAGTYKAVYFVELASKNPSYHISRDIIVRQKTGGASVNGSQPREPAETGDGTADTQEEAGKDEEPELTAEEAIR